jgi:hypothetical protein
MLGLRCAKHKLFNGSRPPAEECDACTHIHAANRATHYVPELERMQPINVVVSLGQASSTQLLAEIGRRLIEDG